MLILGLNTISANVNTRTVNFIPTDIRSCNFWFDFSNSSNVTVFDPSINTINSVDNLGELGNGFSLANSDKNSTPILVSDGTPIQGLSYANFNGTDQFLYICLSSDLTTAVPVPQTTNYSIFAVVDNEASGTVSGITGGRNPNMFVFRFLSSGTQLANTIFDTTGSLTTETAVPANPNLIGSAITTVGGAGGDLRVLWNGEETTPTSISGTPVDSSEVFVGKANNTTQFLTGKIYEIAFYGRTLDDDMILNLNTYAQNKYGINF